MGINLRLHQMAGRGPPHRGLLGQAGPREVYFVTSQPEPGFNRFVVRHGDYEKLRDAFDGVHPTCGSVVAACPDVHKWALVDRDL